MFAEEIIAGTLVPLLGEYPSKLYSVHAIYSGTRHMTGVIKVFIDFVAELMANDPYLRIR